jgi:hypothetical protein
LPEIAEILSGVQSRQVPLKTVTGLADIQRHGAEAVGDVGLRVAAPPSDAYGAFVANPNRHSRPRDVFLFFDNTDKWRAPDDALALIDRVGQATRGNRTAPLALTPEANSQDERQ